MRILRRRAIGYLMASVEVAMVRQSGRMAPATHTSGGVMRRVTGSRGKAFETDEPAHSADRRFLLPVLAILAVASTTLAIMAAMATRQSHRELAEVRAGLAAARADLAQARARMASAARRASEAFARAQLLEQRGLRAMKEAEQIRLREEKRLHEIYPNLRRLTVGLNPVGERYVKEFTYARDARDEERAYVGVTLVNAADGPVRPRFTITLLNKEGAVTRDIHFPRVARELGPGETRREDEDVRLDMGEPVYFVVRFGSDSFVGSAVRTEGPPWKVRTADPTGLDAPRDPV